MNSIPIKLAFIIDDHYFFRSGLANFLNTHYDDLFSIHQTTCDKDGLQLAEQKKPALIFLGLNPIKSDTVAVVRQLLNNLPNTAIIAFAELANDKGLQMIYRAGNNGVLLKSDLDHDLDTAIASYLSGKKYASKSVLESNMMPEMTDADMDINTIYDKVLTLREKQMLELLRNGLNNKEVAARLNIEYKTAYNHRYKLMVRFNVKSFADLIRIAEKTAHKPTNFKNKGGL
jgi:DNA-binding NarL/FixJ family response regulator